MSFSTKLKQKKPASHEEFGQISENEVNDYVVKGQEVWDRSWEILHSDGWKLVKGKDNETGVVHSNIFPDVGKIYSVQGYVEISPEELFNEMVIHVADQPAWNPTLLDCSIVQTLSDDTDICYNATTAQGLIASRDFVNLRHWATKGDTILSAGCAVQHESMPPCKDHVRGENKPGGWVYRAVEGEPSRCIFQWLMNTDLKGWIPQHLIDKVLPGILMDFLSHVRSRALAMKNSQHQVQ